MKPKIKPLLYFAALLGGVCLLSVTAQETNVLPPSTTVTNPIVAREPLVPAGDATLDEVITQAVLEVVGTTTNVIRHNPNARSGPAGERVVVGNDVEQKLDESDEVVVVIRGNADLKGHVRDAAVTIMGNIQSSGDVGDAVVAVMGNATVSGKVGDAVVAILGDVNLEDGANVDGDVISVGGKVTRGENVHVGGRTQSLDLGALGLPHLDRAVNWIEECGLKFRLLCFKVGWAWGVAGLFTLFYLLVSLVLARPVQATVDELRRRPATSFLSGLLTLPVAFLVLLFLIITVVGIIVVAFLFPALLFAAVIGKVALLQYLGEHLSRLRGQEKPLPPILAVLVGALLLTVLYLIPVVGMLTFAVTAVWGLGAAITATFGNMKREQPPKPQPPVTPPPAAPAAAPLFTPAPAPMSSTINPPTSEPVFNANPAPAEPASAPTPPPSWTFPPPPAPTPAPAPVVPDVLAYRRAGFWERMGALVLDLIIVILLAIPTRHPFLGFIVGLVYFVGMWLWRGTTVGGAILGLKVARLDQKPVTFMVALVRALAGAFSGFVLFLGFLWIAWDAEKQGWHDRIAGTVVVRLPRGTPLICL